MWNIEKDPILRSTILAVAIFDQPPDWPRLRARIERATRRHPAAAPARAVAAVAPRAAALGGRADLRSRLPPAPPAAPAAGRLARRCSTRCNRSRRVAFDRARPLWEFTLFEGLEGERAALAMKVHHSVTDGVGGMALLAELVDLEREPDARASTSDLPAVPAADTFGAVALVRDSLTHTTPPRARHHAPRPGHASRRRRSRRCAIPVGAATNVACHTCARSAGCSRRRTAPMSPVMRDRGLGRRLAMFDVGLDDLRRTGKATEGSLNDVFLAAVIGGLRRYHERHGAVVDVAAHDPADQPAHESTTTAAATASRPRASRCRPPSTIRPSGCGRSACSCAAGGPSPRCR